MAINRAPFNALVDDDGSNLVGSVWNKAAIKDVILDPVDAALPAPVLWTQIPFSAANFQWAGVVAGHVTQNQYCVTGKTLIWMLRMDGAPGNNTVALWMTVPGGFAMANAGVIAPLTHAFDNGLYSPGYIIPHTATTIEISKANGGVWTTAGPVYVWFTAILSIS